MKVWIDNESEDDKDRKQPTPPQYKNKDIFVKVVNL